MLLNHILNAGLELSYNLGINYLLDKMQESHGCFMTFHRVAKAVIREQLPNKDFYVDLDFLEKLIIYLKANDWQIVTVSQSIQLSKQNNSRFVNFSVDDAYKDTYDLVWPLFEKHQVPFTVYVTTGIPDGTLSMWNVCLEEIVRYNQAVDNENKASYYLSKEQQWERSNSTELFKQYCDRENINRIELRARHAITWSMLKKMSSSKFVEIGAHTVSHPHLSSLNDADCLNEMFECKIKLQNQLHVPVDHFAFPYGRKSDCGMREFQFARNIGYLTSATTHKGIVFSKTADWYKLPRNTLNGSTKSIGYVSSHLTGISGLITSLTGTG